MLRGGGGRLGRGPCGPWCGCILFWTPFYFLAQRGKETFQEKRGEPDKNKHLQLNFDLFFCFWPRSLLMPWTVVR
jgi:hypothetical protein